MTRCKGAHAGPGAAQTSGTWAWWVLADLVSSGEATSEWVGSGR